MAENSQTMEVTCCIAGGGPAGMMLGFLLARVGIDVLVLEKHADFLRDFRGDTIHPSTLQVMDELDLIEEFLTLPHQKVERLAIQVEGCTFEIADFSRLPIPYRFIAFMPQWDFLDFLAGHAAEFPSFALKLETEATDLLTEGDRICGLRAEGPDGSLEVHADLIVAADGRDSGLRRSAGFEPEEIGAPMDALWMRIPRAPGEPAGALARISRGRMMVLLNRGNYWQCAYVIPKGSLDDLQAKGLDHLKREIADLAPGTRGHLGALESWDDVKLLTVAVNRLRRWYRPGLLCIGDAAHAMSPIGGVGINLAIQDAVAAANILAPQLKANAVTTDDLRRVQQRRGWPTRGTQFLQVMLQNNLIVPAITEKGPMKPPIPFRLLDKCPLLRRIPARLIGMGLRPEHVS